MDVQTPPALAGEEDFHDLGYTEETLFDETDQEPMDEYMSIETIAKTEEEEIMEEGAMNPFEGLPNPETWEDNSVFGLTTTGVGDKKNLDPTVHKALAGLDRGVMGPDVQEELKSYEERPCAGIVGLGKWRVLTEFIKIGRFEVL
ncbi:uncharacterized protein UDID_11090 [Ustilago sp. UG-2017a]|nr:uncharacterized protein UDID_11090 [Ustilago sp. UG-2017a]